MVRARLPLLLDRPLTRGECANGPRPCAWVSCRHHLLLDIGEDGRLLKMYPFDENDEDSVMDALREMPESCSLDVADRGGMTSQEVGDVLGIRRQGVEECIAGVADQVERDEFDERDHPEDPYLKYTNMGADELAEVTAMLRARGKGAKRG